LKGKFFDVDGSRFEGEYKDGYRNGYGTIEREKGDRGFI